MQDRFLKIDEVVGESLDSEYEGNIDVLDWNFNVKNEATGHQGGGSGKGKVKVSDLIVYKYVDNASPTLMKYCCSGKAFASAEMINRKAGGEKPINNIIFELKQVTITSIDISGGGSDARAIETISLNFADIKFAYKNQTKEGYAGPENIATWNVVKNSSL